MSPGRIPAALHDRLGNDGTFGLIELLDDEHDKWSARVLNEAGDRFDRHLTQEMSAVRVELAQGLAGVRAELAAIRVEWVRWSFVFWVSQIAAIAGLLAYMLPRVKP